MERTVHILIGGEVVDIWDLDFDDDMTEDDMYEAVFESLMSDIDVQIL